MSGSHRRTDTVISVDAARWRRRLVATALTLGLVSGGVGAVAPVSAAATSAKPTARGTRVVPIGRYAVGVISETFVDPSRPTNANGSFAGAPNRTLLTAIYYPARGVPSDKPSPSAPFDVAHGPYPLILFSHGVLARGVFYEALLKQWASAGYVVVAPDYPLSNTNAPGGADFGRGVADVKNQPADARFVITRVLKLDETKKLVGGTIDPHHIGAAGHSLGAITTYGLVYSACCHDPRVDAAIPLSGIIGLVEPPVNYFHGVNAPLLSVHGNADPIVPYQADVDGFAKAKPPKFFLTFLGGGHISPYLGTTGVEGLTLERATVDFWDRYLKDDRAALDQLPADASIPGVTTFQETLGVTNGSRPGRSVAGSPSRSASTSRAALNRQPPHRAYEHIGPLSVGYSLVQSRAPTSRVSTTRSGSAGRSLRPSSGARQCASRPKPILRAAFS